MELTSLGGPTNTVGHCLVYERRKGGERMETLQGWVLSLLTGCSETVRSISGSKLPSREDRERGQIVYEKHVETRPALAAIERVQSDSAPCLLLTRPRAAQLLKMQIFSAVWCGVLAVETARSTTQDPSHVGIPCDPPLRAQTLRSDFLDKGTQSHFFDERKSTL